MKRKRILLIPIILVVILAAGSFFYVSEYYHASPEALACLEGTENVEVKQTPQGLMLDGPGKNAAFIFYPGAKVEYTAYLPLLCRMAGEGVDCFAVEMPGNLAIFGKNKATSIMEAYNYDKWYLGGHSLGGAVAAMYAAEKRAENLDGLVLMAAYPTEEVDVPTLTLYGSEDRVLNMEKLEEGKEFLPAEAETVVIEDGNHAQFGDYGEQKGDGEATISREKQWEVAVATILDWMKK